MAAAIKFSQPTVHFTVTQCPDNWPATQRLMAGLSSWLDDRGQRPSWAYAVETNPKGTGYHLHGYAHGWFDRELVQDYCRSKGAGWVHVSRTDFQRTVSFAYPMKTVLFQECTTRGQAQQALDGYRQLNGTRLLHHSHGFFRNGTRAITQDEACDFARERYRWLKSQARDDRHFDLISRP